MNQINWDIKAGIEEENYLENYILSICVEEERCAA
jgi:hypothetical protein